MEEQAALYALSLYVAGYTVMRLLAGSVFRMVSPAGMLIVSLLLMPAGVVLLQVSNAFVLSAAGLILLGAGLAGGFPLCWASWASGMRRIPVLRSALCW